MKEKKPLKLTSKQERFCQEYVTDLNATQAAIRAGHVPNSAARAGWRYLNEQAVKQYLEMHRRSLRKKMKITEEDVLQELSYIAFSNVKNYMRNGNLTRDLSEIDPAELACIASIKVTETTKGGLGQSVAEVKLHSKLGALEKLARHLGLFQQKQVSGHAENRNVSIMRLGDGTEVEI